jgi:FAD/FMN-containing dehydrogenase
MSFTQSLAYTQLKSVFRGQLVLPTDTGYRASLKRWSVLAERNAGVVAFVKDEEDVAAAVKFAVAEKVEIAIKGKSAFSLQSPLI